MRRTAALIVGAGIGGRLAASSPETAPRCLTSSRPVIGMRLAWIALPDAAGFASPDMQGVPTHEEFSRDALDRTVGDLATAPGFARYPVYRDGVVAGAGSMRICDGVAQLCGAATAPVHRSRGIQTALLSSRLSDAARQGCDIAVVTTEPGSRSQQNVQRRGFELLYTRAILEREPR